MKYIILIVLIYFAYKYFFSGKSLEEGRNPNGPEKLDEGDYSDYEEIK